MTTKAIYIYIDIYVLTYLTNTIERLDNERLISQL